MFFGKVYNGEDADASHKATFEFNLAVIAEQNAKNESLKFGINQFTDLSQEQFRIVGGLGWLPLAEHSSSFPSLGEHTHQGETLAASVDWQHRGAVTPVKDQGQCGSCWAFSTTGGLEGAWQLATGSLISMAEQQFVDCSKDNSGCNGGNSGRAISYAHTTAVATESSYSYKATNGKCKSSFSAAIPRGGVSGYKTVGTTASALKSALAHGPLSVSIEADQSSFQNYASGILKSGCGTSHDHAVLVVGYGTDNGQEYFRVKNSWGRSWGDSGYIRMSTSGNVCGILNHAIYAQVSGSPSPGPSPSPSPQPSPTPSPTPRRRRTDDRRRRSDDRRRRTAAGRRRRTAAGRRRRTAAGRRRRSRPYYYYYSNAAVDEANVDEADVDEADVPDLGDADADDADVDDADEGEEDDDDAGDDDDEIDASIVV